RSRRCRRAGRRQRHRERRRRRARARAAGGAAGVTVRALARVNLAAIERNVARLRRELAPSTGLCAVVKADGYGHGALPAGRAALAGGATWPGVATAREGEGQRAGGVNGRLLVMGALTATELAIALEASADVVAWTPEF